jgi:molybdenum cofactor cytidylyltransferase
VEDSTAVDGQLVGVLLAAGFGRRFGGDKRVHALPDGTLMALASARQLQSACRHTVVVVRADDDFLASGMRDIGCTVVCCADAAQGMGHSLATAVLATRSAAGWLVALADMPFIRQESYRLVREALAAGLPIARPSYRGLPGHPVGFSAAWREELAVLTGDKGARDLVAEAGRSCAIVEVDDPGVIRDIDTPADLLSGAGREQRQLPRE